MRITRSPRRRPMMSRSLVGLGVVVGLVVVYDGGRFVGDQGHNLLLLLDSEQGESDVRYRQPVADSGEVPPENGDDDDDELKSVPNHLAANAEQEQAPPDELDDDELVLQTTTNHELVPPAPKQDSILSRGKEIQIDDDDEDPAFQPAQASLEPVDPDAKQAFGACLKIKDDNHWLVEWIAYHWLVLPLDHLTIAVDPNSETSPASILHRWRKLMDISEADAEQYMGRGLFFRDEPEDLDHAGPQRAFFSDCLRDYRAMGFRYAMVVDSDEFVAVHPNIDRIRPGVVLEVLEKERAKMDRRTQPCISLPRREMCAADAEDLADLGYNAGPFHKLKTSGDRFLTYRYVSASPKLVDPKNIVDLAALDSNYYAALDLTLDGSNSNVVYPHCDQQPDWDTSSLRVLHFPGTKAQRAKRIDPRWRDDKTRPPLVACTKVHSDTKQLREWLPAFVEQVGGPFYAQHLLEGNGLVDGWPAMGKAEE